MALSQNTQSNTILHNHVPLLLINFIRSNESNVTLGGKKSTMLSETHKMLHTPHAQKNILLIIQNHCIQLKQ